MNTQTFRNKTLAIRCPHLLVIAISPTGIHSMAVGQSEKCEDVPERGACVPSSQASPPSFKLPTPSIWHVLCGWLAGFLHPPKHAIYFSTQKLTVAGS